MDIPTLEDLARRAELTVLPSGGAWVCITGCPRWPRGQRLIKAHTEIGIQHLDIYWGYKEKVTAAPRVNRYGKQNMDLPQAVLYDITKGVDADEAITRAADELADFVRSYPFHSHDQQKTLISISHPHPEEVRFYNSEIRVFDSDIIRNLLQENCIETKIFGEMFLPALEDIARDIVDSFQIDGLSKAEAYHMLLTSGVEESDIEIVPTWFYRPIGWFRNMFCESL